MVCGLVLNQTLSCGMLLATMQTLRFQLILLVVHTGCLYVIRGALYLTGRVNWWGFGLFDVNLFFVRERLGLILPLRSNARGKLAFIWGNEPRAEVPCPWYHIEDIKSCFQSWKQEIPSNAKKPGAPNPAARGWTTIMFLSNQYLKSCSGSRIGAITQSSVNTSQEGEFQKKGIPENIGMIVQNTSENVVVLSLGISSIYHFRKPIDSRVQPNCCILARNIWWLGPIWNRGGFAPNNAGCSAVVSTGRSSRPFTTFVKVYRWRSLVLWTWLLSDIWI